ncbi:MAG: TIGR01777 family protein [Desulfamplus sp.]|nr:TIGR01777 family protein [Desulfamplus sp.]
MMNIMVTGASGFVGTHLCDVLLKNNYYVTGIGTSKRHVFQNHEQFEWISADTTLKGDWQDKVKTSDVIINLTGKNIFGYWTKKYKSQIYQSRILTTENIVSALMKDIDSGRKALLLNTSAIGYYGDRGDDSLTERDLPGSDFLATVCLDWENAALKAEQKGVRVVIMRLGVVLGKNGGALGKMLPAFKFFVGGPLGKGIHWFPWIHIDDLISAIFFFMENDEIKGSVNLVAPGMIKHREFASSLGHALNRPSFMPAPDFMIKAIMGEMGQAFLSSQKATPSVLNSKGFSFKYSDIKSALDEIL